MKIWRKIKNRYQAIVHRDKTEQELDDEIQFHLEMEIENNIKSGMSAANAKRAAQIALGGAEQTKEECRNSWGTRLVFDFWRDLRYAVRQLSKSKGFTTLAILTLALGIGANTAMFSLFNTLLLRPLPYPDSSELFRIYRVTQRDDRGSFSAHDYTEMIRQASELGDIAGYSFYTAKLSEPSQPTEVANGIRVSENFFTTLGIQPFLGRSFDADDVVFGNHKSLIISHSFWQNRFNGNPDIIGHTLFADGETHEIVGVLPQSFYDRRYLGQVKFFRPMGMSDEERSNRTNHWINIIGRRAPNVSQSQVGALAANIGEQLVADDPATNDNSSWRSTAMSDTLMNTTGLVIVGMLVGLSGFVLLIACANLANFLLARTIARSREFAMRAAIGASRIDLARPLVAESLILALAGGVCSLFVAFWTSRWLTALSSAGGGDGIALPLDWRVLTFAFGVSLVTSLVFSIVPALFATRIDINRTLASGARGATAGRGHQRLRHILVVGQFALALILLCGSGFFIRGGQTMFERDYGWVSDDVIIGYFELPNDTYPGAEDITEFQRQAMERIEALPGVQSASLSHSLPYVGVGGSFRRYVIDGREAPPEGEEPLARVFGISPQYFRTTGTPLLSGRVFNINDTITSPKVAIINQRAAKELFGNSDPIGQRLVRISEDAQDSLEIVGIVRDIEPIGLSVSTPTNYQLYKPLVQELWHSSNLAIRVEGIDPNSLLDSIRTIFSELSPNVSLQDLSTADSRIRTVNSDVALISTLLSAFAFLGLSLASIGIYGVIARSVAQRTSEFGIRMAIGAKSSDIVRTVMKSGIRLALIGATVGLLASFGFAKLIASALPNIQISSNFIIMGMTMTLLGIAILSCYLPARKAAKINPNEALLAE